MALYLSCVKFDDMKIYPLAKKVPSHPPAYRQSSRLNSCDSLPLAGRSPAETGECSGGSIDVAGRRERCPCRAHVESYPQVKCHYRP
jgi:hypothetical protein